MCFHQPFMHVYYIILQVKNYQTKRPYSLSSRRHYEHWDVGYRRFCRNSSILQINGKPLAHQKATTTDSNVTTTTVTSKTITMITATTPFIVCVRNWYTVRSASLHAWICTYQDGSMGGYTDTTLSHSSQSVK